MGKVHEARFEITQSWNLPGEGGGSRVISTSAILPLKNSQEVNEGLEHELVKVICNRNKDDRVKNIHNWNKVKGAVVYSKEKYGKDVDVIVKVLEKHGSAAAFVSVKPTVATSIPVFVLSPQEFKQLLEIDPKFATIVIKRNVSNPLDLSDGDEDEGIEVEAKGLEVDQQRGVKVTYLLQIQCFDLEEGRNFEKEKVKVVTLPFHQDPSELQCNSLQVKQAVFYKGKIINMDMTNPKADVPVLYYSQPDQDQDIIKTLALEAAKCGVPALIVTRDPGMPHNIPVFVFDKDEMRDLMNFFTVSIAISVKGKSPDKSYEDDDATFASPSVRFSYADVASHRYKQVPVEVSNSSEGHKKPRSYIGSLTKGVKKTYNKLVYTPKVKSAFKEALQEWSEDSLESYESVMKQLELAKNSGANSDAENGEIQKQLMEYMNDHDYRGGILLLAFCCKFLCYLPIDDKEKLRPAIAKCISVLGMDSAFKLTDAVNGLNHREHNPCQSLLIFIYTHFDILRKQSDAISYDLIVRLIWIQTYHCNYQFDWMTLLGLIRPEVLQTRGSFFAELEALLGRVAIHSLAVFAQNSLHDFCNVAISLAETCHREHEQIIVELDSRAPVTEWLGKKLRSADPPSCQGFVECMQNIRFTNKNEEIKRMIVSSLLSSFCGRDLSKLPILWQFVDAEHCDRAYFHDAIIKSLTRRLTGNSTYNIISPNCVKPLFETCISRFLGSKKLFKQMQEYAGRLVNSWFSFEEKVLFLDAAYSNFANVADVDFDDVSSFVLSTLKNELTTSQACAKLFEVASRNDIFSKEVRAEGVADSIAELVIEKADICSADDLRSVLLRSVQVPVLQPGKLMERLLFHLSKSLRCKYSDDIETAASLYRELFHTVNSNLSSILSELFSSAIKQWNPNQLVDILCLSTSSLSALGDMFSRDQCSADLSCINESITIILEKFNANFQAERVLLIDVESALEYFRPEMWNILENMTNVKLISCIELDDCIRGMREACIEITTNFSVRSKDLSVSLSLQDIFKRYKCNFDSIDGIPGLLKECHEVNSSNSAQFMKEHSSSSIKALSKRISVFRADFQKQILTLSYFLDVNCALFSESIEFGSWTKIDIEKFLSSVTNTQINLTALVKSSEKDPLRAIKSAMDLVADDWANDLHAINMLQEDFSRVAACPTMKVDEKEKETFHLLSSLIALLGPLHSFVECFKQFQFQFIADVSFAELDRISSELKSNDTSHIGIDTARGYAKSVVATLSVSCENYDDMRLGRAVDECVCLFAIFKDIRNNPDVFSFIRDAGWIGEEGRQQFYAEFGNVTNKLLFANTDSFESNVLDSLEPAVRFLSVLASLQDETSVQKFVSAVKNCFNAGAEANDELRSNLETIQQNIRSVREWFDDGIDDMTAIFSTFQDILNSGMFHSNDNVLCLSYKSGEGKVSISGPELEDLLQQLGFVQHEDAQIGNDITGFLDNLQLLRKVVDTIAHVERVGYSKGDISDFTLRVNEPLSVAASLLARGTKMLDECNVWRQRLEEKYPLTTLFSISDLRGLYKAIANCSTECNHSLNVIVPTLATLVPPKILLTLRNDVIACAKESLIAMKDDFLEQDLTWLEVASEFIEAWHKRLGEPRYSKSVNQSRPGIFLHSFDTEKRSKDLMILGAMKFVYKNRLPETFEVYDGSCTHSFPELQIFLRRVVKFPQSTFMLLNVQDLPGNQQETIVNYVHSLEASHEKFNLHCVQLSDTMLHCSPSVEHVIWSEKMFKDLDLELWKSCITEQSNFNNITVVTSEFHGTGKTRLIRKEIESILRNDGDLMHGSICIHEGTTIDSLLQSLRKFQTIGEDHIAIHFSFMLPLESYTLKLLTELNYFFNHLLLTRCVKNPCTGDFFAIGWTKWSLFVEVPRCSSMQSTNNDAYDMLRQYLPVLSVCARILEPPENYDIDDKARRVCTYLRAYEDGTINRKFESAAPKQLMFVIDASGSMNITFGDGRTAFAVAISNALTIFDSHVQVGDFFGTIIFSCVIRVHIPLENVRDDDHKQTLRNNLAHSVYSDGGTSMYSALNSAIQNLQAPRNSCDSWIVCLTDGASDGNQYEDFRRTLMQSSRNLHVMMIGVNLYVQYQHQMETLCDKFEVGDTQGVFISSQANVEAMTEAFGTVAARIPVSQTFELDGVLSDLECKRFIEHFLPTFVSDHDMLRKKFWIEFLYRRVRVFDENEDFNYNESHDNLGSSLIQVMLHEADQLISTVHNKPWKKSNHEQLIYDFSNGAPEFRLICTAPDLMTNDSLERYKALDLPGFFVPTTSQLRDRATLDRFLSQALDVPLTTTAEDGLVRLQCIDENRFVLTLDFVIKMLNMHERIACRVPCIIEGETGVSKTALTKMYSILRNSSLCQKVKKETNNALQLIVQNLRDVGLLDDSSGDNSLAEILRATVRNSSDGTLSTKSQFGNELFRQLVEACKSRSSIYSETPTEWLPDNFTGESRILLEMLDWFVSSRLEKTFFELNVDASLTEDTIVTFFAEVSRTARKVEDYGALVVVFLDEVNTSSVMGLCKEIIIDSSICGEDLPDNVVVVAACNPSNRTSLSKNCDLARDWASGHYIVNQLPRSMESLKWEYGALNAAEEKEFVLRRIELLEEKNIPTYMKHEFTEMIAASQEAIRTFASKEIFKGLKRHEDQTATAKSDLLVEARSRAKASVSLRDIQRVFSLFQFFTTEFPLSAGNEKDKYRTSMLLTIAIVYYLRLDYKNRKLFLNELSKVSDSFESDFQRALNLTMDQVTRETKIPQGIALTDGLKENVFMTLVCSLSLTPLVIVGPPGSSKTLSLNIIDDNANGLESTEEFYRGLSRLSTYHYQCSRSSTSLEVSSVFEKAIQRQSKVNPKEHKCLVFMDEAGLPEESKESLKVLHYYLEGHMSTKAKVAFVAITNHVLDAAKSNRCVSLLRQDPREEEMLQIAEGVLFAKKNGSSIVKLVSVEGEVRAKDSFASRLCLAYKRITSNSELESFFGLRDFIYLLQDIRGRSQLIEQTLHISLDNLLRALERNFNGLPFHSFRKLVSTFIKDCDVPHSTDATQLLRNPIEVVREALSVEDTSDCRYSLIIDESDDDSIMRILKKEGLLDISTKSLFKLSNLEDNAEFEKLSLVSGVKFAAQQGSKVVLSQTDSVNESFYDLFNQHFRRITNRNGEESLFANIAVGGISRRSRVGSTFRVIVHVRASELPDLPAPFLNRFEKFRLSFSDLFASRATTSPFIHRIFSRSMKQVNSLTSVINLCGFVPMQTIESYTLELLSGACEQEESCVDDMDPNASTFSEYFLSFLKSLMDVTLSPEEFNIVADYAQKYLPLDESELLADLMAKAQLMRAKEAFLECFQPNPSTAVALLVEKLLEIFVTRHVIFTLSDLATPEDIYMNRNHLPREVIGNYFQQQHFSLKDLLKNIRSRSINSGSTSKCIIHTRTNAHILSIPSLRVDTSQANSIKIARSLIADNPEVLIIEHMNLLKDESSVRSAINEWSNHEKIDTFLLLIDMSDPSSIEVANFVRCCIDQVPSGQCKTFALLLHYSPASFVSKSFYPALFLDDWRHVSLDDVDGATQSNEMKYLIEKACNLQLPSSNDIRMIVDSMVVDIRKTTANCNVFYESQVNSTCTLYQRHDWLEKAASTPICNTTVEEILCDKFAALWTPKNLEKLLRRASWSLRKGTSQLGLTRCLKTIIRDIMRKFFFYYMLQLNEWKNFDLLRSYNRPNDLDALFCEILCMIPVLPFEELILHQVDFSRGLKPLPLPTSRHMKLEVKFPFFSLVCSYLEQLIEDALRNSCLEIETNLSLVAESIMNDAMDRLRKNANESKNSAIVLMVVERVMRDQFQETDETFFNRYLNQFIVWTLGYSLESFAAKWFSKQIKGSPQNLLLIHISAIRYKMELIRLSQNGATLLDCEDLTERDTDSSNADLPAPAYELVEEISHWLVRNLQHLRQNDTALEWTDRFESLYETLPDMMGSEVVQSQTAANWLRISLFFHALQIHINLPETLENAITMFYEENGALRSDVDTQLESLVLIISKSDEEESCKGKLFRHLVKHFFSPRWVSTVDLHWKSDLVFLVSESQSLFNDESEEFTMVLLRNAFIYGGRSDERKGDLQRLSNSRLAIINSHLSCNGLSKYSPEGQRLSLPHFIPKFALDPDFDGIVQQSEIDCPNSDLRVYFSEYKTQFHPKQLTEVVFQIVLEEIMRKSEGKSSEGLFLAFMRDMELETTLSKLESTRILRTISTAFDSFVGTSLGVLILEARLVAFLFSISFEMGKGEAVVMEGLHSENALALLDHVMLIRGSRWQEIFMGNIERVYGRSTLVNLLRPGGCLHSRTWTEEWSGGLPELATSIEGDVSKAERELRDVSHEEDGKARDMRLCPNCAQPFLVDQWNCGSFVCGRSHTHVTPVNGLNGCGHQFNGVDSPLYRIDENRLEPLRQKVREERLRLQIHGQMSRTMWGRLGSNLPCLSSRLDGDADHFYPISIAIKSIGSRSDIVRHIVYSQKYMDAFLLIPDLVELYCWIQNTFRYIITFEQAQVIKLSDVMDEKILSTRFDTMHSNHILMVYERVKDGLCKHLHACDYKVNWDCETLELPFRQLEDASLVKLLSVYDHPTDGYDYFFIIINQLIQQYNQFILNFANQDMKEVSPLALLGPKSTALKSLRFFNSMDFSLLVEGHRKSNEDDYNINALEEQIKGILARIQFTVLPPIKHLRTKFMFRTDITTEENDDQSITGLKSSHGHHFVHVQDFQLFETCIQHTAYLLNQSTTTASFFFTSKFHSLDYEQLREILEGMRNLLQSSFLQKHQPLNDSFINGHGQDPINLNDFGFPSSLSVQQSDLLLSLKVAQVYPFIQYIGFQLASESYNFAALPLTMKGILSESHRKALRHNLIEAFDSHGAEKTLKLLREFKEEILGYYQRMFRDECEQHSQERMKEFIENNNFSDSSDPIFAALPDDLTTRHYVALNQELHQLYLFLLSRERHGDFDFEEEIIKQSFANPRRGDFWLLYNSSEDQDEENLSDSSSLIGDDSSDHLWFESILQKQEPQSEDIIENLDANGLSDFGSGLSIEGSTSSRESRESLLDSKNPPRNQNNFTDSEHLAASKIQHWWRSRSLEGIDVALSKDKDEEPSTESAARCEPADNLNSQQSHYQNALSHMRVIALFLCAHVIIKLFEYFYANFVMLLFRYLKNN